MSRERIDHSVSRKIQPLTEPPPVLVVRRDPAAPPSSPPFSLPPPPATCCSQSNFSFPFSPLFQALSDSAYAADHLLLPERQKAIRAQRKGQRKGRIQVEVPLKLILLHRTYCPSCRPGRESDLPPRPLRRVLRRRRRDLQQRSHEHYSPSEKSGWDEIPKLQIIN